MKDAQKEFANNMTHIARDVGDVPSKVVFPRPCPPNMCMHQTEKIVLKCMNDFVRVLGVATKPKYGCPSHRLVAFEERIFAVEVWNIGGTIVGGLPPEMGAVRFCGELVLSSGQHGYEEASQTYLMYNTPHPWLRAVIQVDYAGEVIAPMMDRHIPVERRSAKRFDSPMGAMKMVTTRELVRTLFGSFINTRVNALANVLVRLVEIEYDFMFRRDGRRGAKEVR